MINFLFWRFIKIIVFICSSFFSGVPSSLNFLVMKIHLIITSLHLVVSTSLSFRFIILLLPEFFMEVLHGSSSRILCIFYCSSIFLLKLRSAKLYSKINMVFNTCLVLRSSSILHLSFQSEIPSTLSLRWRYIILDNFLHVSWFTCCQNEVF